MLLDILQKKTHLKVSVKYKDYDSTIIRIHKSYNELKLSVHKLFIKAPEGILQAICNFCFHKDKKAYKLIKSYADRYFSTLDSSYKIKDKKFVSKGKFYDLKQIFDNLNLIYFDGKLNLKITWFNAPLYKKFRHITFGSYNRNLKLVRINKLIDQQNFPFYFINYIVYHEMLHDVCKLKNSVNGYKKIHTKEFKQLEKRFAYYKEAKNFEKKLMKKGRYGWA